MLLEYKVLDKETIASLPEEKRFKEYMRHECHEIRTSYQRTKTKVGSVYQMTENAFAALWIESEASVSFQDRWRPYYNLE